MGSPGASKASPDPTAEAPLALLVAEELQRLSAFEASASGLGGQDIDGSRSVHGPKGVLEEREFRPNVLVSDFPHGS